jgi:DNA-binding NtrC family response regulator
MELIASRSSVRPHPPGRISRADLGYPAATAERRFGGEIDMLPLDETPDSAGTKKILIVDDDEALLFAFRKIFRDTNVLIDSAATVQEAKVLVSRNKYALVIADLRLAEADHEGGLEVIRHAKETSPRSVTVLWTAFSGEEVEDKIVGAAPDHLLRKPVPSEKIRLIMEEIGLL